MTKDQFQATLSSDTLPAGLAPVLVALWHDARGNWHEAHAVAQDVPDPDGAWVHAYLHRKEGDLANASYWYRRAGKAVATGPLQEEWNRILESFLTSE